MGPRWREFHNREPDTAASQFYSTVVYANNEYKVCDYNNVLKPVGGGEERK